MALQPGVEQLVDGVGAGGVLGDVGLHDDLGVIVHAVLFAGLSHAVDVVLVVGIGGLTDQDQADLQLVGSDAGGGSGVAAAVGGGVSIGAGVAAAAGRSGPRARAPAMSRARIRFFICVPPK